MRMASYHIISYHIILSGEV